ncbi:MAG: Asp-tRNA(Asn)/Glu-tRNA(Gln) amidotransferase subunit GatB [Bacteroidetes bacterium]|nr:Asp-tRNA(Asn)/Glu-tRNA(Gln) amidotransferase subunit GatB [Bacteroidota bacterium]
MEFEAVIGLEIHVQLSTKSKAFSADSTEYGGMPNTQVSPISLGHPGTLPRHNQKAVEQAIKMGLALHCDIRRVNHYSRKNYFYADLPKGYQITQFDTPICNNGFVKIKTSAGTKNIGLIRIHMEEDTGKSMHDQDLHDSLLDFNRAGTPLIEVVTLPEITNGDEAYAFVSEVRRLVRYLDICDGNMEEGSLRCDANVSIRPVGTTEFGTKVEVKNMNSISNVKRAIDFEIQRQTELILSGGLVVGETRGFNGLQGTTFSMRKKEMINDYRYFPEPDLPPMHVTDEFLESVRAGMPELPETLYERFTKSYQLSEYDAGVLTDDKATALYFEELAKISGNYKASANWVSVNIRGYLNENGIELSQFPLSHSKIAELIVQVEKGVLSHSAAAQKLFPAMVENPDESAAGLIEKLGLAQNTDGDFIENLVNEVLAKYPEKVAEYKSGKSGLLGLFVGEVMKASKGKAEPKKTNEILLQKLG